MHPTSSAITALAKADGRSNDYGSHLAELTDAELLLCSSSRDIGVRDSFCARQHYAMARICDRNSGRLDVWTDVRHTGGLYNKKLSYRRETARQLHMTTWAGQLTF